MKRSLQGLVGIAVATVVVAGGMTAAAHAGGGTVCRMKFNLKAWSAFYKSGKGEGTITCDNGQSAGVKMC